MLDLDGEARIGEVGVGLGVRGCSLQRWVGRGRGEEMVCLVMWFVELLARLQECDRVARWLRNSVPTN